MRLYLVILRSQADRLVNANEKVHEMLQRSIDKRKPNSDQRLILILMQKSAECLLEILEIKIKDS